MNVILIPIDVKLLCSAPDISTCLHACARQMLLDRMLNVLLIFWQLYNQKIYGNFLMVSFYKLKAYKMFSQQTRQMKVNILQEHPL